MSREPDNVNPPPEAKPDPLAASLARLEPAPPRIDRDRLMYTAGAESRRSTIRLWQATAGFLAAVGFFAGMAVKPPSIVERVVVVDREAGKPDPIPEPAPVSPAPVAEPKPAAPMRSPSP